MLGQLVAPEQDLVLRVLGWVRTSLRRKEHRLAATAPKSEIAGLVVLPPTSASGRGWGDGHCDGCQRAARYHQNFSSRYLHDEALHRSTVWATHPTACRFIRFDGIGANPPECPGFFSGMVPSGRCRCSAPPLGRPRGQARAELGGEPAVQLVQELACPDCEVAVHDLRESGVERARQYGVQRVPAIAVDGMSASCGRGGGEISREQLQAAGIRSACSRASEPASQTEVSRTSSTALSRCSTRPNSTSTARSSSISGRDNPKPRKGGTPDQRPSGPASSPTAVSPTYRTTVAQVPEPRPRSVAHLPEPRCPA